MKKIFDEKFGLAVNVFSTIAIVLLLLCAYIFKSDHAVKHSAGKERSQVIDTQKL